MRSTIIDIVFVIVCSLSFLQCGGPKSPSGKGIAAKDSTRTTDSLASQASPMKSATLTYEQEQGKILYTKYCAICHGNEGKGDGFNAFNLDPKPRDFTDKRAMAGMDDATLLATITEGGKGVNKSPLMPAWSGRMSRLELQYVIAYAQALRQQQ